METTVADMVSAPEASAEDVALADQLTGREMEYAQLRQAQAPKAKVAEGPMALYDLKGNRYEVDNAHDYNYYLNTGEYLPETEVTKSLHQATKDADTAQGVWAALGSSYLDELTMGAAGYAASKSMDPLDLARLHILQERSPIASFVGKAAGFASMLGLTAGVGGIGRATAGTAVKAAARTAVEGAVKEGVTASIGKALTEVATKEVAASVLGKVTKTVAKQAALGAAMNAPLALTEAYYGDYKLAGETLAHGAVIGSLFGVAQAGVGAAISGVKKGAGFVAEKAGITGGGLSGSKISSFIDGQKSKALIQGSRADAGELRRVFRAAETGKVQPETLKLVDEGAEETVDKMLKRDVLPRDTVAKIWEEEKLYIQKGEHTFDPVRERLLAAKSRVGEELGGVRAMSDSVIKPEKFEVVNKAIADSLGDLLDKKSLKSAVQPGEHAFFTAFMNRLKAQKLTGFTTSKLRDLRVDIDQAAYSSEYGSARGRVWRDVRSAIEDIIEKRVQAADSQLVSRGAPPLLTAKYQELKRRFAVLAESEQIFTNAEGRNVTAGRYNIVKRSAPIFGAMLGADVGGAIGATIGSQIVPMGVEFGERQIPRMWTWVSNAVENKDVIDSLMRRWSQFGDRVSGSLSKVAPTAKVVEKAVISRERGKKEAERIGKVLAEMGPQALLNASDAYASRYRNSLPETSVNMDSASEALVRALDSRNPYNRAPELKTVGRSVKSKPVSEVEKVKWADIVALAKEPAMSVSWMQKGKLTREHIAFLDEAFPAHAEQIRKMAAQRVQSLKGSALYSYRALMREPGKTVWFGPESAEERKSVIKFTSSGQSTSEMTKAQRATAR